MYLAISNFSEIKRNIFLNTFIKINTSSRKLKIASFLSLFYAIVYFVLPFLMRFNLCRIIFGWGKFSILHEHFCIFIFLFGRNIFYYKKTHFTKIRRHYMCENCLHMKNLKYRLKLFVGKTAGPIFQLLGTATAKIFKIFAKRMRC